MRLFILRKNLLRKRFFYLSWYNILSNVTVPLAGLVDTAILGHLPNLTYLGGVALGSVVFDYLYWPMNFLRMGTTGLTAQARGKKQETEEWAILYRVLTLAIFLGILIILFSEKILEIVFPLLPGEKTVKEAAAAYFLARILGAPAVLANFAFNGWFLGRESVKVILALTFIGNLMNIGLDYLFIMKWHFNAAGAGYATMISQYSMSLMSVMVILFHAKARPIDLK
ncbi:MAG: MATE family efflux transporter, partial [Candidatus Hydrogenedentota bacterium]